MPAHRLSLSLAGVTTLVCLPLHAAPFQWDGGAGTGNWQTLANWNPDTGNPNFNGTYSHRLNVNGTQTLVYSTAEGTTVYNSTTERGLVIGSGTTSGSMSITGGTFSIAGSTPRSLIGNGTTGTSSLSIDGGTFIGNAAPFLINFGLSGTNAAVLNVNSGTASIPLIRFSSNDTTGVTTGTGTLNLAGGTLTTNQIDRLGSAPGTINFNGGTLQAGASSTTFLTGLTAANVNAGAVIDTNGFDITIGQALLAGSGAGTLVKDGAGVLTLSGANTFTGAVTINAGTLSISRTGTSSMLNDIGGNGSLSKAGTGVITMEANTYTGATTIQAGAILATANDTLGTAAAGTTISSGGALGLAGVNYTTAEALTISGPGVTTGVGTLIAVQRGAIQGVSGASTWTGDIVFTNTANTRIGVQDGASLTVSGKITEQTPGSSIAFRHGNTTGSNITLTSSSNSWSGFTDVFGGSGALILGTDNAIPVASTLRVGTSGIPGTSTLDLNGRKQTVAGLSQVVVNTAGTITNSVAATTSRLTVDGVAGTNDTTYSGTLTDGAGAVALTKDGTSTLTLTNGASTYTGGTIIEEGRLLANNATGSATGTGDVTVNSGGTFGGTGVITGSVITTSGAFLSPGASIESLTIGGASGAGTLVIEFDGLASAPIDFLAVTGNLDISGMTLDTQSLGNPLTAASYVFASYSSLTGTFATANVPAGYTVDYQFGGQNEIALVQIPEPGAASLGALAAGLLLRRRRRA